MVGSVFLNLLIVDDDKELCALMREFFAGSGMTLDCRHDGPRGLARALENVHDLVLLDVMLPGLSGMEVLRQLRKRSQIPVIMLTALSAQSDRIAGLESGADDYLSKPFGPEELLARVRAVLRRLGRAAGVADDVFECGGVRLRLGTREAWCGDEAMDLTAVEFDILDFLMRSAGRAVTRDEITAVLHQRDATPFERTLDVHISHLRKKLGAKRGLIRTHRGVGYLFCDQTEEEPLAGVGISK